MACPELFLPAGALRYLSQFLLDRIELRACGGGSAADYLEVRERSQSMPSSS